MLNNFVGEFLVLVGAAQARFLYAVLAGTGVILSAVYMLWLVQRAFYGPAPEPVRSHVTDMNLREWALVTPLVVMMIWMGVGPQSFLPSISTGSRQVLELVLDQPQTGKPAQEVAHAR